jgi:hypothetical protein
MTTSALTTFLAIAKNRRKAQPLSASINNRSKDASKYKSYLF